MRDDPDAHRPAAGRRRPLGRYVRVAGEEVEPVSRAMRERLSEDRDPDPDRPALLAFALRVAGQQPPTPDQALILGVLDADPPPMTSAALAERARTTPVNATRILAVLRARGWIDGAPGHVPRVTETGRLARELVPRRPPRRRSGESE